MSSSLTPWRWADSKMIGCSISSDSAGSSSTIARLLVARLLANWFAQEGYAIITDRMPKLTHGCQRCLALARNRRRIPRHRRAALWADRAWESSGLSVLQAMGMSRLIFPSLRYPIVQAPMAGGPSTPALAAAVSGAGGLGFLAAGYKTVDQVERELAEVRSVVPAGVPYGINVFAPPGHGLGAAEVSSYADRLRNEAQERGVALGHPRWDDDGYGEKLDLICEQPVPVVSLTFGCPTPSEVNRLQSSGSAVWVTVTTVGEAQAAQRAGVDALVVQGVEAGGHRGGFDDADPGDVGLLALLQLVQAAVNDDLPLVATGGLVTGRGIAAVLACGAAAAQLGTAFMLCPEAGTASAHRDMISRDDAPTALTRAFTGRTARGIVNRFLRDHAEAPSAYPEIHHLTAPLRTAARVRGDRDGFHLWAGQAHALAQPLPAADLVVRLGTEAREALRTATL
jgi:nitronate monooxygenase